MTIPDESSSKAKAEAVSQEYVQQTSLPQSGSPLWLYPTDRSLAAELCRRADLIPVDARIVAAGGCHFLRMSAFAFISGKNEVVVVVLGNWRDAGRSVLVRVWTRDSAMRCKRATFDSCAEHAVARAVMGVWDGLPVAGLTLLSVIEPGEEW
jgi:hypothetical protein